MYGLPLNQFSEDMMTSSRPRCRELGERSSNGMRVRLLWLQGTRRLWVEVREADDRVLAIPVQPERALDAFHHPYAYAGRNNLPRPTESLVLHGHGQSPARKREP